MNQSKYIIIFLFDTIGNKSRDQKQIHTKSSYNIIMILMSNFIWYGWMYRSINQQDGKQKTTIKQYNTNI